ncbi:MAG: riboflavin biosynthesis protein RibF [Nannocystaceae bacterium]
MKVLRQLDALSPGTAACIGAFDGLHLGHRALLDRAAALQPRVALVTFDPHPAMILAPSRAPTLLQSADQRARVCAHLGLDALVLLPFTRAMAAMEPGEFVRAILIDGLRPASVVVGADFRFGAGRRGGIADLRAHLEPAGIDVAVVELRADEGAAEKIGSSAIRAAIRDGDVEVARAQLGRIYAVEGEVIHGAGRGRGLGVPTANVACPGALLPPPGVYAAALQVVDPSSPLYGSRWAAAANLGTNPTFTEPGADAQPVTLEVHALDVDLGDRLYGLRVEVGFVRRLRDERRFPGADALREAIAADLDAARELVDAAVLEELWSPLPASQVGAEGAR